MAGGKEFRQKLALLWLIGVCLRLTVLAVPPLLGSIHRQLHLDETAVGALTSLPVLLLAVVAVPGSLLVAKFGARHAVLLGLVLIAAGGAARGFGSSVAILFAGTFVMGCGVAICQPSLPSLVRGWMPGAIGLATAGLSNGMLIGEILPVATAATIILPLAAGSWQAALVFWSIPVSLTAILLFFLSDNEPADADLPPARWWPDWSDRRVWLLGLTLGGASASYWGANAFIPDLLRHQGHGAYITAALTSLNIIQLPASFFIALAPERVVARAWPLAAAGALTILTAVGLVTLPPVLMVGDAGLLGLSTAWVFVLALALPPLVAEAGDTHRLSAAMFTISYLCPFAGSLLGGALWDATGAPEFAFMPVVLGGAMILLFPARLDLSAARDRVIAVVPLFETAP